MSPWWPLLGLRYYTGTPSPLISWVALQPVWRPGTHVWTLQQGPGCRVHTWVLDIHKNPNIFFIYTLSHNNEWIGLAAFSSLRNGHQDDKPYWGVRKYHSRKSSFVCDVHFFPSHYSFSAVLLTSLCQIIVACFCNFIFKFWSELTCVLYRQ